MAGKRIPLAVQGEDGPLYQSEAKIYPREVDGRFQRLRKAAVFWLLGMYYLFPWLNWDDRQAVLFDLPARKFYIFWLNFWPQDFFFLALLLIMAGLSLFFFTALAGRLWCGYACPQTVWTEVFIWIERWTEGDRFRRMKLDAAPWSTNKLLRTGGKHVLWLVFALWTGFTFVGFFTPIRDLTDRLSPFEWGGWEVFWVLFYSLATWGNAGFLREQVCKYMCPYARFQSAMFDRNTLVIAYDDRRGEPRGPRRRGEVASVLERDSGLGTRDSGRAPTKPAPSLLRVASKPTPSATQGKQGQNHESPPPSPESRVPSPGSRPSPEPRVPAVDRVPSPESRVPALGDCIDCTLCVQVCPTGIDIRNGLQYECIACGACIDACDGVMDKMGYPRGLVRYSTQNAIDGKPGRVLRPRILVYGTLLTALFAGWAWGISQRSGLIVDVLRDRNALYREASDGSIENAYTLKLVNKQMQAHRYRITIQADPAIRIDGAPLEVAAGAEQVLTVPVTLLTDPGTVSGRREVRFIIEGLDDAGLEASRETSFFAPLP